MTTTPTRDAAAFNKITKARTGMIIDQPFFGTLSMRLQFAENNSIPTLRVDGKLVEYNAAFMNGMSNELAKSALAHEIFHCVLDHCGPTARGKGYDPEKWNYAADYKVNQMLEEAGMKIGDDWLRDTQYDDKTAEQIYQMMPQTPPGGGGGPGTGNPGQGPLDQLAQGTPDPAMQAQQAAEWKVATIQAANAAKAVGKLHASLDKFVEKLGENKVDWAEQLRRFITTSAKNDYSYRRFNRKMQASGHYLPGLYSEEMGTIVIASDESGSIAPDILKAFGAEIAAIKQDLRPEKIILMHFDTEVGKIEEFGPDDEFVMKQYCSGGTDFRPAIVEAEKLPVPPLCMVYLTDLYGPFPDSPPDFPVLWVSINKEVAPFGETIPIEV